LAVPCPAAGQFRLICASPHCLLITVTPTALPLAKLVKDAANNVSVSASANIDFTTKILLVWVSNLKLARFRRTKSTSRNAEQGINENSRWDIQRSRIARILPQRILPQPIPHRPPIALKEPNSALSSRRANHSQALVSANFKQQLIVRLFARASEKPLRGLFALAFA
jgi:hypothetical protein